MDIHAEVVPLEPEQPDLPDRPEHLITIIVDGQDRSVRPGVWLVSKLKAKLKIDPALVLAQITPQGLKDLADDQRIHLHEGEQFMTHGRSGGSS